jgi:hypothetical protein
MEFIKKNLGLIIIVSAIIAVVIYVMRNKKTESSFMVTGCQPGEEPNPTTGQCGDSWSWDQMPAVSYETYMLMPEM